MIWKREKCGSPSEIFVKYDAENLDAVRKTVPANQICISFRHLSSWERAVSRLRWKMAISKLCIVRILLLHEAMSSCNVSDGRYIEREKDQAQDGALWHAQGTLGGGGLG